MSEKAHHGLLFLLLADAAPRRVPAPRRLPRRRQALRWSTQHHRHPGQRDPPSHVRAAASRDAGGSAGGQGARRGRHRQHLYRPGPLRCRLPRPPLRRPQFARPAGPGRAGALPPPAPLLLSAHVRHRQQPRPHPGLRQPRHLHPQHHHRQRHAGQRLHRRRADAHRRQPLRRRGEARGVHAREGAAALRPLRSEIPGVLAADRQGPVRAVGRRRGAGGGREQSRRGMVARGLEELDDGVRRSCDCNQLLRLHQLICFISIAPIERLLKS